MAAHRHRALSRQKRGVQRLPNQRSADHHGRGVQLDSGVDEVIAEIVVKGAHLGLQLARATLHFDGFQIAADGPQHAGPQYDQSHLLARRHQVRVIAELDRLPAATVLRGPIVDAGECRVEFAEINLDRLQQAVDSKQIDAKDTVNAESLVKAGVLRRSKAGVRLLGRGELKAKLNIEVHGASKSAIAAVEKAGGSVKILAPAKEDEGKAS